MSTSIRLAVLLFVSVFAVFSPVVTHEFIHFDDPGYVYNNPHVRSGLSLDNARWAFTTFEMQNWHPLTWLSHQLDARLFGLHPAGHHLTSVLLHACSTVVLFLFLSRATGYTWRSFFVAALFGLHPLHVESVAWIAQRKDVLSGLFGMVTLLAYVLYRERPGKARYSIVVASLGLGLMAKPTLVTLPFLLLLLDYWPLRQPGLAVVEKLPLFALSAASSIMTLYAQSSGGAVATLAEVSVSHRAANALVALASYIVKMFYPTQLAILYPFSFDLPMWKVTAALALVSGITAAVLMVAARARYLAVGWLWYLGALIPVIGIVQVGSQAMADRYTYIPLIGLSLMVAWGVPFLVPRRNALIGAGCVALSAVTLVTVVRVSDWKDSIRLFSQSLEVTGPNLLAHHNLGVALADEGRDEEALRQYMAALQINPRFAEAYYSLGNLMMRARRYDAALHFYSETIRLQPGHAQAHNNAGVILSVMGRRAESIAALQQAVQLMPESAGAHYNLATQLLTEGRADEAAQHFAEARKLGQ